VLNNSSNKPRPVAHTAYAPNVPASYTWQATRKTTANPDLQPRVQMYEGHIEASRHRAGNSIAKRATRPDRLSCHMECYYRFVCLDL